MTFYIVAFVTLEHDAEDPPLAFLFSDYAEAMKFRGHIRNLYGFRDAEIMAVTPTTYDSAIEAVVDAIGPSPER